MNYASGLSAYVNKGRCGMPELIDDVDAAADKSRQLAAWIRDSRHLVVITGAGVSTAAGIPDFRGPAGMDLWLFHNDVHKLTKKLITKNLSTLLVRPLV